MRTRLTLALMLSVCLSLIPGLPTTPSDTQAPGYFLNTFLVQVEDRQTAERVARDNGFLLEAELPLLNMYVLTHPDVTSRSRRSADDYVSKLMEDNRVRFAEQQVALKRVKRSHGIVYDKQLEFPIREVANYSAFYRVPQKFSTRDGSLFDDEFFKDQWYLQNNEQTGGKRDIDLHVMPVWQQGFNGLGVRVTTLDDGVDHEHPDIRNNYDARASADFNDKNDKKNDPTPDKSSAANSHGTRCAGEIAAEAGNGICGVGVAFRSSIGGIRILDGVVTDELEARALLYEHDYIHIYSASWGPHDDGKTMEAPHTACREAFRKGVETGRNGLGNLYIWATGNGGSDDDHCGADGYVGSIESISVQSLTDHGDKPFFGERCCSTMIAVPTGGEATKKEEMNAMYKIKVVTTDLNGGCVENFEGTSSAAPLASGVYALVLQANPNLTWRDVQHITAKAARIPIGGDGWTINGAGYHVNDKFGFGMMDATVMVHLAQQWVNKPQQRVCESGEKTVDANISPGQCHKVEFPYQSCQGDDATSITNLEHVQLHVHAEAARRGDVEIYLESPASTRSLLIKRRMNDDSKEAIDFTFLTVHNWEENPAGTWVIEVCNTASEGHHDSKPMHFTSWALTMYGYHDDDKKKSLPEKAKRPDESELQTIMRREYDFSRSVTLKRAVDLDTVKKTEEIKKEFDEKADKILGTMSHLFQGRSFKLNDLYKNKMYNRGLTSPEIADDSSDVEFSDESLATLKRELLEALISREISDLEKSHIRERSHDAERHHEITRLLDDLEQYLSERKKK
ncbi:PC3-like endoprotease variant B [Dreissena polymorpha]|uniref:PC3-like endoprotease variant B n=1 Tax=Dreissena polymorpha TaxID=45954 RepID=UPI002264CA10|nr:PC3-like endoprotease variant B [Dreissena polymorpha]